MKKILCLLLVFLASYGFAQQDLSLYQLSGIPQNNLVNPSQMPDDKIVVGFPALSSIKTSYNNKAFSVNEGLYVEDGTLYIDPETLVNTLSDKNYVNTQLQNQWFLVGYRLKNHYFKVGVSEKASLDFAFPKTLFDFVLRGNAFYLGERVSISDLKLNISNYREISLGYATKLNEKWQVGGHVNLLFGLANITTQSSSLGIYTDPVNYDITINGQMELNTSGLNSISGNTLDYLKTGSNFGLGLDLGATFTPNEKWEFSMSLLDLGYINWKNDLKTFTNNSSSFTLSGLDIKDFVNEGNLDGDSLFTEIRDSLENEFGFEEVEKKYTTYLSPKWYGGAKFSLNSKNRVYATTTLQFYPTSTRFGLSLGYEFDLNKNLGFTANYSIFNNAFTNFGLGLRLRAGPVQIYALSDSMLSSFNLFNYRSIHFRFGINLLFGEVQSNARVKNNLL